MATSLIFLSMTSRCSGGRRFTLSIISAGVDTFLTTSFLGMNIKDSRLGLFQAVNIDTR